jgi:hypothetical protein
MELLATTLRCELLVDKVAKLALLSIRRQYRAHRQVLTIAGIGPRSVRSHPQLNVLIQQNL